MIKGVVPVIVTPLTADKSIDLDGLLKLYEWLDDFGVEACWALGSTGEEYRLTRAQRESFLHLLCSNTKIAKKTICGTGEATAWQAVEFLQKANYSRLKGVHFLSKDTKQSDQRLIDEILYLADAVNVPVWLYNNVQRGKEISESIISAVWQHPNIAGVKYGARNHMPFIKAMSYNCEQFQVLSAGHFYYSCLAWGGSASTTSEGCVLPGAFQRLSELFTNGKVDEARNLANQLLKLSSKFPKTDNGESSAQMKYVLHKLGICQTNMAYGSRELNNNEKHILDSLIPEILELNR